MEVTTASGNYLLDAACITKIGLEKSVSALELEQVSLLQLITFFKFLINEPISFILLSEIIAN